MIGMTMTATRTRGRSAGFPELLQRDHYNDHDSDDNGDTGD